MKNNYADKDAYSFCNGFKRFLYGLKERSPFFAVIFLFCGIPFLIRGIVGVAAYSSENRINIPSLFAGGLLFTAAMLILLEYFSRRRRMLKRIGISGKDELDDLISRSVPLEGNRPQRFFISDELLVNTETAKAYKIMDIIHMSKTYECKNRDDVFTAKEYSYYTIRLKIKADPYSDILRFKDKSDREEAFRAIMEAYKKYGNPGQLL
ncbi:MAG: hypothetical protein IKH78_08480 [Ruminococcus sp.]|nr:hypothetical protein [Ruminococcus sp.]